MYKKQMTVQRILCILSLVASALVFVYSLGIMTDLFDMLYKMMPDPSNIDVDRIGGGARIYYDMQGFNHQLLWAGIILILVSVVLFLTNTHSRRKYYIGNFFATGLTAVSNLIVAIWAHGKIAAYKATYLATINFDELQHQLERRKVGDLFTKSTFWFDIHYLVFALLLIVAALLVANAVWKTRLMKEEQQLLRGEKGVQA